MLGLDSRKGRLSTFGLLYISEGIPYGFTSIAMVAFLRQNGVPLDQIGIFAATLFIPWSFKFAWAPLIDLIKVPQFGGRKAWIGLCLTLMIVSLLCVHLVDFRKDFELLLLVILVHNIFCATQDVAIDSLAVSTLKPDERASGNGIMFGGQYLGIALGGGAAVYVMGVSSFEFALVYVSLLQLLCLLYVVFFVSDPDVEHIKYDPVAIFVFIKKITRTLIDFIVEVYRSFWQSGSAPRWGFLFALFPTGALVLAYAALSTIPVDYGFNETEIAQITTMNTVFAAMGSVIGGVIADKFGLRKMIAVYYVLSALPGLFLAYHISAVGLTNVPALYVSGALVVHGFLFGMVFGTMAAIFMGLTNPLVAATQFTAFMATKNLVVTYTNAWQGIVAENFDYATVLYIDAALILLGLAVIPFLKSREESGHLTPVPAHQ